MWLALLPAVVLLTACGGTGGTVAEDPAAGDNRPTATVTVTAPAGEAATPATETVTVTVTETVEAASEADEGADESAVSSGNAKFGETWAFEDGLQVTVSKPETFKPDEWSMGGEGYDHAVRFTVTIVNKTGENFDPTMFHATVQSGDREGDQIFDSANGLEGAPSTVILDGRETTFDIGFGVDDPKDIVMELTVSWDHDEAIFTS